MAEPIDIIARLGIDSTGVVQELDKVNAKYAESNKELKNTRAEIAKLQGEEKRLLALRSQTNSPTIVAQFNNEIKKTKEQIDKLIASEKALSKETAEVGKQTTKTSAELNKAFDSTKVVPLRSQLRQLKEDLANATDPAEINRLAIAAGKVQDKIEDANEAARIFASESKFQAVGNALGNIGSKLLQLDFKGAADASNLLVKASSQITFKNALGGIKDLGTTLFNVGKALLTNPLFLIGAAVALVVLNFEKLKKASGPIGEAFKFIGLIVDGITNSFSQLTDAIGLTNNAMEKFAEGRIATLNKIFEVSQKQLQAEIDIRRAAGKETEELEIKKLRAIIDNSKEQLTLLNKVYKDSDNERRDSLINAAFEADTQIKVIQATAIKRKQDADKAANKKFLDDEAKKLEDAQAEADRLSSIEEAKRLRDAQKAIDAADALGVRLEKEQAEQLNERQRHELAMLGIQEASQLIQLESEIRFEKERLENLKFTKGEFSQEVVNQNNKIIELEAKKNKVIEDLDEESKKKLLASLNNFYATAKNAADQVLDAEIDRIDKLTSAQEKRVEDAKKIAENGNAELLELEKKRLDDLNKEREKFVRAQQALAAVELIAETAVMVAKAGAEGGAAAGVTIAAALLALIAGLVSARSIAGQAAFFEGGEGYTGDGNIREQSLALGKKDYIYHKKEYIFNNEKTSKYLDHFRDIHSGKMDLNEVVHHAELYKMMKMNNIDMSREVRVRPISDASNISDLKGSMKAIEKAINSQERTKVVIDQDGISVIATHYIEKQSRLNKLAS